MLSLVPFATGWIIDTHIEALGVSTSRTNVANIQRDSKDKKD